MLCSEIIRLFASLTGLLVPESDKQDTLLNIKFARFYYREMCNAYMD